MSDVSEDLPSKTDTVAPVSEPEPLTRVALAQGELEYLRNLKERNKLLTMVLGDRLMTVSEAQAELENHRKSMKEAFSFILTSHGITQGEIDTEAGTITIIPKA